MNKIDELKSLIEERSPQALLADGFDEAIIGLDTNSGRVIYDLKKMIEILMKDMTE